MKGKSDTLHTLYLMVVMEDEKGFSHHHYFYIWCGICVNPMTGWTLQFLMSYSCGKKELHFVCQEKNNNIEVVFVFGVIPLCNEWHKHVWIQFLYKWIEIAKCIPNKYQQNDFTIWTIIWIIFPIILFSISNSRSL